MSQLPAEQMPLSLQQLEARYQRDYPNLAALGRLAQAGMTVAPLSVIPAEVEGAFYRLNNLPAQLAELFDQVDLSDPDEDDIEELEPQAQLLFRNYYLLDEFIDVFYEAIRPLASTLQLRRPGQSQGVSAVKGRPCLLALKSLWLQDWNFDALMARLVTTGRLGLEPRPVLISPAGRPASSALNQQASLLLGREVSLEQADGAISNLLLMKR
jgi:hypothetical protein